MATGEDVQLPDLQVIQRYSLAVRGATAPLADVVEALRADLAWLTGGGRPRPAEPTARATAKQAATAQKATAQKATPQKATPQKAPMKKAAAQQATAKKATAKKATAKRTGARRA